MLKMPEVMRDEMVKIIGGSNLPTNQGLGIIQALNSLESCEKKCEAEEAEIKE